MKVTAPQIIQLIIGLAALATAIIAKLDTRATAKAQADDREFIVHDRGAEYFEKVTGEKTNE